MIGQMYKIFGQVICQLDKKDLVKKHLNTNKNIEMVQNANMVYSRLYRS